jgi:hypothetical protein
MKWLDRTGLAKTTFAPPQGSLIFAHEPAEYGVPLGPSEIEHVQSLSRRSFERAGLAKNDRVLFAIGQDGASVLIQAIAPLVSGVALAAPEGRLRLLTTIRALKPTVLVATPCGAADFLARLYMEFNVDPVELDLHKIILLGEIASPGVVKRVGKEFEAEVAQLYCDPIFGAALACRKKGGDWEFAEDGALGLAALDRDEILAETIVPAADGSPLELVLRPVWSAALKDAAIRTGEVVAGSASDAGLFNHTVGEHVLVRGRWISLPLLRRQLALIDGISGWTLTVDRGDRTLDSASISIVFERETLVSNPMWKSRIQQALGVVTPVRIDVTTELLNPDTPAAKESVADLRKHHLGVGRARISLP